MCGRSVSKAEKDRRRKARQRRATCVEAYTCAYDKRYIRELLFDVAVASSPPQERRRASLLFVRSVFLLLFVSLHKTKTGGYFIVSICVLSLCRAWLPCLLAACRPHLIPNRADPTCPPDRRPTMFCRCCLKEVLQENPSVRAF